MATVGRPSIYSDELADTICARLAMGEGIVKICKDDDMPCVTTIYRWLRENEAFNAAYTRAREDQADTLADEILEIADTPEIGEKTVTSEKGVQVITGDMTEHRKIRIDARKFIAAKLKPRKYGVIQSTAPNEGNEDAGKVRVEGGLPE